MKVLLIKMSSMGDVFHTFPALSDAQKAHPDLQVDWVVEKSFSDISTWHPVVNKVFAIELRRWRKTLWKRETRLEIKQFFESVTDQPYDLILDAQGLVKSGWVAKKIAKLAKKKHGTLTPIAGPNRQSAREPLAAFFYQQRHGVKKGQHAILRLRQLFAKALDYAFDNDQAIEYGLDTQAWQKPAEVLEQFGDQDYLVFLHGTTWQTKYWPEENWIELLGRVQSIVAPQSTGALPLRVIIPWGNEEERLRAIRIAESANTKARCWVPSDMLTLKTIAQTLFYAKAVVSVDTGLSHVGAALNVPLTVLYRVTDPVLIGADGPTVTRLVSPLAPDYIKKFSDPSQAIESLHGLSVDDVMATLSLRKKC